MSSVVLPLEGDTTASDASSFVTGQVIGVDGGGVLFNSSPLPELVANAKASMAKAAHPGKA